LKIKLKKKRSVRTIFLIILFILFTVFLGTYIAYKLIGGGDTDSEIISKQEENKPIVQDETQSFQNTVELKIYYTQDYKKLSPEIVIYNFTKEDKVELATFIVEKIFSAPNPPHLHSLLSSDFKLKAIYIMENLLIVDIDNRAVKMDNVDVQTEALMVYSIVNSLIENIKGIESVQILLNGEIADTLMGHINITKPLIPQLNLM